MKKIRHFWFIKIHPVFNAIDDESGKRIQFENWRENIVDVWASDLDNAKDTALITGIKENVHYNDVIEEF